VVAPCLNEAAVLPEFAARLLAVADACLAYRMEILFVDDGSRDASLKILCDLVQQDARIRVISLSRNFGHQLAIVAGLDHCEGEFIVVIDTDLQDPPELIPAILNALDEGSDIVHMVRQDRRVDGIAKRVSARLFYAVMRRLVLPELPADAPDFKGFNRQALTALRRYREHRPFLRGILASIGFRQTEIRYTRDARHAGHTKYPWSRIVNFAIDAVTAFSMAPLRLSLFAGIATCGGVAMYLTVAMTRWLLTAARPSSATLYMVVLPTALAGLILVSLGIIGEYLGRLYREVQGRPLYLIRDLHGFTRSGPEDGVEARRH